VKAECAAFDEENQLAEHALDQLRTHFPLNTDKSHVLLKVLTLNKLYSTRINDKDIEATARHIAALGIDSLLDQGSHSAVDLIANIPNLRRCYSFATKFCSWHNPAAFPLYDGYVDLCLWSYRRQADQEVRPPFAHFHRQDIWNYSSLVEIVTAFRNYYGMNSMPFKDLDKFLWRSRFQIMQKFKPE
jgi:hypothetical protein